MVLIISSSFNTIPGLLDRTWVAGVTPGEFSLAHFIVSLGVNFIQVIVTLACMIYVFQVSPRVSYRMYIGNKHHISQFHCRI